MYRNDAVVVFEWEKIVFNFGFENKISSLHKAFHGEFSKGIASFLSRMIILDR